MDHEQAKQLAQRFVRFVETGDPSGVLADEVFCDINDVETLAFEIGELH